MDARLLIALLLFLTGCCLGSGSQGAKAASSVEVSQYIEFLPGYNQTHDCRCNSSTLFSEYDFWCEIIPKTPGSLAENDSINCSELPTRVIAHLNISCSGCYECVIVNLHEMTRAHLDKQRDLLVYPPSEIALHECQLNSLSIGLRQLDIEGVNTTEGMEVAQFGVPQSPGVGGYYTVNVTYPSGFNEEDCWLNYLHVNKTNLWFLPAYVMHKCQHIRSINIIGSPITWVSMHDLLSIRSMDSLTLQNCNVMTFADDAIQVALAALDEYLQSPPQVFQNPRVNEAVKMMKQMRQDSGRMNVVTHLYDAMDTANISFSLLFGYRSGKQDDHAYESDIPYGIALSYVNLAYNKLTEIPFAISMFGNLAKIDLSHNEITSLYRNWLCWYPPIPDKEKATSNRHCYWFRGSRETLKILDLSYNRINQIGEIQPWHGVSLAELYLDHNHIMNINSDAFTYSLLSKSLLTLFLDNNPMPYFHLASLSRLEVLNIRNGELANIEPISIPKSSRLTIVNLTNNKIGSIAPMAFNDLPSMNAIDLRNNSLNHIFGDSFVMFKRSTLSSRVVLLISGQTVDTICDCNHVYAKILSEESGMQRDNYTYPTITPDELNTTKCDFFSIGSTKTERRVMWGTHYRDFLCEFSGDDRHKIPERFCKDPDPPPAADSAKANESMSNITIECWETCVPQCTCYHSQEWEISDLNCNSINVNMVRFLLTIPVKYMDLSGIQESDYFHRISEYTLKWKSDRLSNELLVLYLNNSNVHYIEENAFKSRNSLMLLYLHDNKLETVPANAFCSPDSSLRGLTLTNNELSWLDPELFNETCLPKMNEIKISDNPWTCKCDQKWLALHDTLIKVSRSTQIVSDFQSMLCQVDPAIIEACSTNSGNPLWQKACEKVFKSKGSRDYPVSDEGRLISVCNRIADTAAEQRKLIVLSALAGALGLVLLSLVILAFRRRHRLLAVVRVLILLKYQRDRRAKQQVSRDSLPYDAMLWAADRDQDCLVDVLNCVRSASGGDELELCVPESFLYSDLCSCPLTYFDCPAEGAKFSGKVVVALSERFLDTQYLALCQVIRELDSVGRNPFRDIVFLRLSSHRVSLQRPRHRGPEDVEAFTKMQRILSGSDIVYKSVDWEYRLIDRIRSRHSSSASLVAAVSDVPAGGSSEGPAVEFSEGLVDFAGEDQPLVLEVEPEIDIMRSRITAPIRDWPPFHSDRVPEVFIMSASDESSVHLPSSTSIAIEHIVCRLPGVRLGTNDAALVASWPDSFEAITVADRIDSFLMKRTRQFVLLLNNSLLNWLKDEAALQVEFQAFLAANTFRRRLLVILVGQVDSRSKARYKALANQRLDEGKSGSVQNWFDITADGGGEMLGRWLDSALFRRHD